MKKYSIIFMTWIMLAVFLFSGCNPTTKSEKEEETATETETNGDATAGLGKEEDVSVKPSDNSVKIKSVEHAEYKDGIITIDCTEETIVVIKFEKPVDFTRGIEFTGYWIEEGSIGFNAGCLDILLCSDDEKGEVATGLELGLESASYKLDEYVSYNEETPDLSKITQIVLWCGEKIVIEKIEVANIDITIYDPDPGQSSTPESPFPKEPDYEIDLTPYLVPKQIVSGAESDPILDFDVTNAFKKLPEAGDVIKFTIEGSFSEDVGAILIGFVEHSSSTSWGWSVLGNYPRAEINAKANEPFIFTGIFEITTSAIENVYIDIRTAEKQDLNALFTPKDFEEIEEEGTLEGLELVIEKDASGAGAAILCLQTAEDVSVINNVTIKYQINDGKIKVKNFDEIYFANTAGVSQKEFSDIFSLVEFKTGDKITLSISFDKNDDVTWLQAIIVDKSSGWDELAKVILI